MRPQRRGALRLLATIACLASWGCGTAAVVVHERPPIPAAPALEIDATGPAAGRLPAGVHPERYDIALVVDPKAEGFEGRAVITTTLERPRERLYLHAAGLEFSNIEVVDAAGVTHPTTHSAEPDDILSISVSSALPPGTYTIALVYRGRYASDLNGLYIVALGADRYAVTQFEPVAARRVFPCFDEPAFKAVFALTLTVPDGLEALSNTPITESVAVDGGRRRVRFADTTLLSTYLVALAVGPFDVVTAPPIAPTPERPTPLPLSGVAPRGRGAELGLALHEAAAIIPVLEQYFARPYPFAKLDIVAVPDFEAGAMENAGLVTFRDSALLAEAGAITVEQEVRIARYLGHELAHQWFGNLVTMRWWNDIWLNEAFATFMETTVSAQLHPEHEPLVERVESGIEAMQMDSLAATLPIIRSSVVTRSDIIASFDWLTYIKGDAVLGMFEHWLGPEAFRAALRGYMARHAWQNATSDDLWSALGGALGRDVAGPMRTFTTQAGVPVIDVKTACDGMAATVTLSQSRYRPAGSPLAAASEDPGIWQLPVCLRYGVGARESRSTCVLLATARTEVRLDACPRWIHPNAAGAGYYRWTLPDEDLRRLTAASAELDASERLAMADAFGAGFAAGAGTARAYFEALQVFARDATRAVAEAPIAAFAFSAQHLIDDDARPEFERYVRATFGARWAKLGLREGPHDSDETKQLRASLANVMASVGRDPGVRKQLAAAGRRLIAEPTRDPGVAPDLRTLALVLAAESADVRFFDAVLARLRASDDGDERALLIEALGAFVDPALAQRARELAFGDVLRTNEKLDVLARQGARARQWRDALDFVKSGFDRLLSLLGPDQSSRMAALFGAICTPSDRASFEAVFASRAAALPGGEAVFSQATEAIRLCEAKVAARRSEVSAFFARGHR